MEVNISNELARYYNEIGKTMVEEINKRANIPDPIQNMSIRIARYCFFFPTSEIKIISESNQVI